jgi:hypothetical protein
MVNGDSLLLSRKGCEKILGSKRVFDHHRALDVAPILISARQLSKLVKHLKSTGAMEHIIHGLTFLTQQPDADSVQCGRSHSVWQVSVDVHDAMSAEQDRRQNENSERLPKRDLLEAEDVWDNGVPNPLENESEDQKGDDRHDQSDEYARYGFHCGPPLATGLMRR